MRFLICSDLHSRPDWYFWLTENARLYDALIVAGDLVDMFRSGEKILRDCSLAEAQLDGIALAGTPVFCSEGNHDASISWPWMKARLGRHIIGDILVQTLPDEREKGGRIEFNLSRAIAKEKNLTWLAVDHYPPIRSRTHSGDDYALNRETIDYGPNIVISGHMHQAPFLPHGSWFDLVDRTLCLNAGCLWDVVVPCHIILDFRNRTAAWIVRGQTQTIEF